MLFSYPLLNEINNSADKLALKCFLNVRSLFWALLRWPNANIFQIEHRNRRWLCTIVYNEIHMLIFFFYITCLFCDRFLVPRAICFFVRFQVPKINDLENVPEYRQQEAPSNPFKNRHKQILDPLKTTLNALFFGNANVLWNEVWNDAWRVNELWELTVWMNWKEFNVLAEHTTCANKDRLCMHTETPPVSECIRNVKKYGLVCR